MLRSIKDGILTGAVVGGRWYVQPPYGEDDEGVEVGGKPRQPDQLVVIQQGDPDPASGGDPRRARGQLSLEVSGEEAVGKRETGESGQPGQSGERRELRPDLLEGMGDEEETGDEIEEGQSGLDDGVVDDAASRYGQVQVVLNIQEGQLLQQKPDEQVDAKEIQQEAVEFRHHILLWKDGLEDVIDDQAQTEEIQQRTAMKSPRTIFTARLRCQKGDRNACFHW